jgi:hypothetical protein
MSLRAAAQQALLALEFAYGFDIPHLDEHLDALDDLRTALAEPVQEPVAWMHEDELPSCYPYDLMFPYSKVNGVRLFPVFGPSPQRKPLTDEEMKRVCAETFSYDPYVIARAIERAHGIGR